MNKKFGSLSSSADPQKLATSIQGLLKVVGGIVAYLGYTQVTGDINSIVDQIGAVVTLGYSFYGAVEALYGLSRKLLLSIHAAWVNYSNRS